jgi:hypothetical protein
MEEEEGQHENGRPQSGQQSYDVSEHKLINQYRKRNQFIPDVHKVCIVSW